MKKAIRIKDLITKETVFKGFAKNRKEAVAIVKQEFHAYMTQGDRIVWQYLNESDPNEKKAPRIAQIQCSDGEYVDFIALISDHR